MLDIIDERLEGAFGRERLRRLHGSRVAVIGGGLLGGQLLHHLAMLQIRTVLVEPGRVDAENVGNQMLPAAAVGESKADARLAQMRALNPSCPVRAVPERLEEVGLGAFADCDLLLSGLDGRASRLAVNRIAQWLGLDWIDAAVDGSGRRLLGTVSYFRPGDGGQPCLGCRYDAGQLATIAREVRRNPCASWRDPGRPETPPTLTASPFGAIVAGWQMSLAIRALLGEGEDLVGHQLQVTASGSPRVRSVALARRAACGFPHRRLAPLHRLNGLEGTEARVLGELVDLAAGELGAAPDALVFPGRSLALGLACPACGVHRQVVRRCEAITDEEVRCACGSGAECVPLQVSDRLEAPRLAALAHAEWGALGIPDEDLVTATAGTRRAHYLLPAPRARAAAREDCA